MAADQDVNTADQGHCGTCGRDVDMKFTIQCAECEQWIHYTCSALPLYLLLCLARTTRKYTCEKCSFDKYADPTWTAEASEAMERMRKEKASQPKTNTTSNEASATPPQTGDLGNTPEDMNLGLTQDTPPLVPNTDTPSNHHHPKSTETTTTRKKVPICRYYKKGVCKYGISVKDCKFGHPKPCRKYLSHGFRGENGCNLNSKCTMFHPTLCRNSLRKHECFVETCRFINITGTRRKREAQTPPRQHITNVGTGE